LIIWLGEGLRKGRTNLMLHCSITEFEVGQARLAWSDALVA